MIKKDKVFKNLTALNALFSIIILALILLFILKSSLPVLEKYNFIDIVTSQNWSPTAKNPSFGLLPMILATVITTIVSVFFSAIIGISIALFITRLAPLKVKKTFIFFNDIMVSIPSIILGFFGLKVIVPYIYNAQFNINGMPGNSMLAAIIVLSIMVVPTIVAVSASALNQVDQKYELASMALGANKLQTVFKVNISMAKSGLLVAILLGIGRVVSETMVVLIVAGNVANMPNSLLSPIRTLTANIATEINYASGLHQSVLFFTGVILFMFIIIINIVIFKINRKGKEYNVRY